MFIATFDLNILEEEEDNGFWCHISKEMGGTLVIISLTQSRLPVL